MNGELDKRSYADLSPMSDTSPSVWRLDKIPWITCKKYCLHSWVIMTACVASHESKVTNFWSMEEKSSFQNFITAYIFFTSKPPNLQKVFLIFIYLFFAGRWCPFYWVKVFTPLRPQSSRDASINKLPRKIFQAYLYFLCVNSWRHFFYKQYKLESHMVQLNGHDKRKRLVFFAADCLLVIQVGKSERSNML